MDGSLDRSAARDGVTQGADVVSLQGLVETLQRAETLEATVAAAVRVAPALVGVAQCWLFLVDTLDDRLLPVGAWGTDPDAMPAFYALGGAPRPEFVRRMIATRLPVIVRPDGSQTDVAADVVKRFDVKALLLVPLVSGDRLVGAMALHTPGRAMDFPAETIALARTIALHV